MFVVSVVVGDVVAVVVCAFTVKALEMVEFVEFPMFVSVVVGVKPYVVVVCVVDTYALTADNAGLFCVCVFVCVCVCVSCVCVLVIEGAERTVCVACVVCVCVCGVSVCCATTTINASESLLSASDNNDCFCSFSACTHTRV